MTFTYQEASIIKLVAESLHARLIKSLYIPKEMHVHHCDWKLKIQSSTIIGFPMDWGFESHYNLNYLNWLISNKSLTKENIICHGTVIIHDSQRFKSFSLTRLYP